MREKTRGACVYCGTDYTRGAMLRHLAGCKQRKEAIAAEDAAAKGTPATLVHLQVRDAHSGDFWLNLEVDASTTLQRVDDYLRAIWLECCGHLSRFGMGQWGADIGKARKVGQVFRPGVELTHVYDFGDTSVTLLKAVGERDGKRVGKHPIRLMARNAIPSAECQECGAPAKFLCRECWYEDDAPGLLCEAHAEDHPHEEYGDPLPVVNSPRMGVCGYEGPAEPPY